MIDSISVFSTTHGAIIVQHCFLSITLVAPCIESRALRNVNLLAAASPDSLLFSFIALGP